MDEPRVDLVALVRGLPLSRRKLLAKGPMLPGEMQNECRVCEALLDLEWRMPDRQHKAAAALLDYHGEAGQIGPECYQRCVSIYRAAGWTGEYDARDLHGFEGDDG